ncbi:hypothetical protein BRARA_I04911 [Brassica rapa]|uniref:Small ribosomal subunit protein uS15c n=1 Tax=Brassica campestris TaxID=3711 RepID=A0A397Y462_BRACM|nr:hypothetical protein BRARA_I04911 [Brassica rapa]
MALLLARRHRRFPPTPSLIRFFSNSSSDPPPKAANASVEKPPQSPANSPYSSPFTDIKYTLKNKSSQARNPGWSRFSDNQSRGSSQDLSINLAKFQRRSAAPPPKSESPSTSFESLYRQNVAADSRGHGVDLSTLRENLKNLKSQPNAEMAGMSLRRRNVGSSDVSVIGKEMEDGNGGEGETEEYLKMYREDELGEKLRMLRPEGKKEEGWFSFEELNERLVKLRQVEKKEVKNQRWNFSVLRNVIGTLEDDKAKNEAVSLQNLDILGYWDGTPEYKHYPPKDELVETYFHSDNLSSAEKMKIELTKVREDFKMSESDCGSARVQVAQLTTKIKHLTSALHKKDKHSRKGLVAMVQKRKKLLKYLRRTDWDSYCLVLSQLSLRDTPDYKIPNYNQ